MRALNGQDACALQLALRLFHLGVGGKGTDQDAALSALSPLSSCAPNPLACERLHKARILLGPDPGDLQVKIGGWHGGPVGFRHRIFAWRRRRAARGWSCSGSNAAWLRVCWPAQLHRRHDANANIPTCQRKPDRYRCGKPISSPFRGLEAPPGRRAAGTAPERHLVSLRLLAMALLCRLRSQLWSCGASYTGPRLDTLLIGRFERKQ